MYMYQPFNHKITKTTVEHVSYLTDMPKMTIYTQIHRSTYNDKLRCFFSDDLPRARKKKMFNEKVNPDDEYWKYSDKYGLYVSNLGRFKTTDGAFKFPNNNKGYITVILNNHKYRAADIVYETYFKNLKGGYHAYPKDSDYSNITADNLFETTLKKYRVYRRNTGNSRALYLIDKNNRIAEEFVSTTEASRHLFLDRRQISRLCSKNSVRDGHMFMWARDYKECAL
ncbi:hypothetical protein [Staphylococcus coagulans]|uniref:hypothetical protein n=1 Tax=Staphylococcus coagulans TaxID=74706 RepID=UPI00067A3380|nr:hypothetical protein NP71_09585 [Staphylococcus schleiferi]